MERVTARAEARTAKEASTCLCRGALQLECDGIACLCKAVTEIVHKRHGPVKAIPRQLVVQDFRAGCHGLALLVLCACFIAHLCAQ